MLDDRDGALALGAGNDTLVLDPALHFYRDGLGLLEHAIAPKLGVANFYAGAPSPHLIAVNVWQGTGASPKSADAAGLRHSRSG